MTENIVTGKKYRILTDEVLDVWDRISLWTKASDVYYNDNSTAENNRPVSILKRNSAYAVGTVAYESTAPSWVMLKCTTAGTTATSTPSTYQTISAVGTVITDGTAKFSVYDVRPTNSLSTSAYLMPTVSLVNNLDSELSANGNKFYFDYKNGSYGFNTSSSRAASTFVAFGGKALTFTVTLYTYDKATQITSVADFHSRQEIQGYSQSQFTFTENSNVVVKSYTKSSNVSVSHSGSNWVFTIDVSSSDTLNNIGAYTSASKTGTVTLTVAPP